jgi:UDP-N-acetylglucosamine--N-acetylmuramyl-(pentapeptide) pyrophosphoryl-undecaprenol N-acetylglucosamine transferase
LSLHRDCVTLLIGVRLGVRRIAPRHALWPEGRSVVFESTIGHAPQPLRIVIAGGGSGGHVSPAVAVVTELRARMPIEPLWIGARQEYEGTAAAENNIPFRTIRAGKLRRYFSLATPGDLARVPIGTIDAMRIMRVFRPHVVVSTGGFVSVPTIVAGWMRRVPTLTHEQTAHIGLATRINARFCDVIALSFERSRAALPDTKARIVVTGNPVRRSVLNGCAQRALDHFELPGEMPLVYVTGGAQGSRAINRAVADSLPSLLERVEMIHQCGPRSAHSDFDDLTAMVASLPFEQQCRYRLCERVGPELGDVYAATSLVVGRAGAGTIAELAAAGLPSVLIPLPGAEEQRQNALYLVDAGAAFMLPQAEMTPMSLATMISWLIADREKLDSMALAARNAAAKQPTERLIEEILRLATGDRTQANA